ncbi:hypothetical protein CALVIDRAFT_204596 [Calocera viscosa TUFC12733]|uniref:Uncharacterized protein n=1 Tax=Calocera viscosa (strain TUFC12733) TaxID=1330018 RepID=A0A167KCQ0_CALVF|nr:hypothetical protein CALVIDRAFT_204596 [Calocera viscosa TUFC12733]
MSLCSTAAGWYCNSLMLRLSEWHRISIPAWHVACLLPCECAVILGLCCWEAEQDRIFNTTVKSRVCFEVKVTFKQTLHLHMLICSSNRILVLQIIWL